MRQGGNGSQGKAINSLASIEVAVFLQRPGQSIQILLTGDFDGAKLFSGGGEHLDVEELVAASLQVFGEVAEGGFPGVGDVVEHGFAGEKAAGTDAVDAARQFAIKPALDTVGMAGLMQGGVGANELGLNPGTFIARAFSAGRNDFREGLVYGEGKFSRGNRLGQASRDMEFIQLENRTRVG